MHFKAISTTACTAALLVMTALAPVQAQAETCLSQEEAVAEKIRRLKTTLMVGALQCDHKSHLKVTESYNAFVNTHGGTIQAHDKTLARYFQRAHGGGHRTAMDRHVTTTANRVASQSYKNVNFCEGVAKIVEASLAVGPDALLAIAENNSFAQPTLVSCKAPVTRQAEAQTGS